MSKKKQDKKQLAWPISSTAMIDFLKYQIEENKKLMKQHLHYHQYGDAAFDLGVETAYMFVLQQVHQGYYNFKNKASVSLAHYGGVDSFLTKIVTSISDQVSPGHAMFCEHANELPKRGICKCKSDCTCRQSMCPKIIGKKVYAPAMFCDHANELPKHDVCSCASSCACKAGTCK